MAVFTVDEYNIMVDELLYREPISFNMLMKIAEKTLRPKVQGWCRSSDLLRGYEEDILQDIYAVLLQKVITHFLLRNGSNKVSGDPEEFRRWLYRVAENIKNDNANWLKKIRSFARPFEEYEEENFPDPSDLRGEELETVRRRLSQAFSVVLDADIQVYKILTWLAHSLFILRLNLSAIKAKEKIREEFEQKTLYEMRDLVYESAGEIPWLEISAGQRARIDRVLAAPYDGNRPYGAVRYREYYMKKGGKQTISDWIHRVNDLIKRETML